MQHLDDGALADGYIVNHTPMAGARLPNRCRLGHVSYVIKVDSKTENGQFPEMNNLGPQYGQHTNIFERFCCLLHIHTRKEQRHG